MFEVLYQQLCTPGLKFDCLQGQSVVQAEISDHNPIVYASNSGIYCSFNILTKCDYISSRTGSYYNNGFYRIENEQQYQDRLINFIIPVMRELITISKVDCFLLQEAPDNNTGAGKSFYASLNKLFLSLKIDFKMAYNIVSGVLPAGGLLTICFGEQKMINLTDELTGKISQKNKHRFQAMQVIFTNGVINRITNFHADYNNQDGTKADLDLLISLGYLVGGDFNLLTVPDEAIPKKQVFTVPGLFSKRTIDGIYDGRNRALVSRHCCCRF